MANKDSVQGTLIVAAVLCVFCSIIVSSAAVFLKDKQEANAKRDIQRNILMASGLYQPSLSVEEQFANVTPVIIDLKTGKETDMNPEGFDQEKAAQSADRGLRIPTEKDLADIKRRSRYALIYKVMENGQPKQLVLPVKGKGLWGTMWAYIAIAADTTTVKGFAFYQHKETPGLGGEVDNPNWKALWPGIKIYGDDFDRVEVEVIKGKAPKGSVHKVDGISGATITTRGIKMLLRYWFGDHGYGPYLNNFRNGSAS